MRWLVLNLEAPRVAFGGIAVDGIGNTRDHPALSAITGLIANAIGLDRADAEDLGVIQSRLVLASARLSGVGERVTDFQTARLGKKDKGWTKWGAEGRAGSAATYDNPTIRQREYLSEAVTIAVITLRGEGGLSLDEIARAFDFPERPLFIGRKSCLPSGRISGGMIEAESALEALRICLPGGTWRVSLPEGEGEPEGARIVDMADKRNWRAGYHAGSRRVLEATIEIGERT